MIKDLIIGLTVVIIGAFIYDNYIKGRSYDSMVTGGVGGAGMTP
jgi:hypothetical protein